MKKLFLLLIVLILTSCTQNSIDEDLKENVLIHEKGISNESVDITITEPLVIDKWDSMIKLQAQPSKNHDKTGLNGDHNAGIDLEISRMFKLPEDY